MVDFLVIGPFTAVSYNNIFPFVKDGAIRLGSSRVSEFTDGTKFGNSIWFSNISDHCPPMLELKKQYNEVDYPKFDNYDAINVDRIEDIPYDYDGVMGVPVTYLDKWNSDQFEVLGVAHRGVVEGDLFTPYVNGVFKFTRWIIKKK